MMKLEVAIMAALVMAAGPAAAEGSFASGRPKATWTPGGMAAPKPSPGYGLPSATPAPAYKGPTTSRIYGPPATPKAEPFKPYEPYKPSSVYGQDAKKKRY